MKTKIIPETKIGKYLNALRDNRGLDNLAAKSIGMSMAEVRHLRKHFPNFSEMEADIAAECADMVEAELLRRAIDGVDVDKYNSKGEYIATVKEYSDPLLLAAIKAKKPNEYGDKKQITGGVNANVEIVIRDFSEKSVLEGHIKDVAEGTVKALDDLRHPNAPAITQLPKVISDAELEELL